MRFVCFVLIVSLFVLLLLADGRESLMRVH